MASDLTMILADGTRRSLGETDGEGEKAIELSCELGDRILAEPFGEDYFNDTAECFPVSDTLAIHVVEKDLTSNVLANAMHFEAQGDLVTAAMGYIDLSYRLQWTDAEWAEASLERGRTLLAMHYMPERVTPRAIDDPILQSPALSVQDREALFSELNRIAARRGEGPGEVTVFGLTELQRDASVTLQSMVFYPFVTEASVAAARAVLDSIRRVPSQ